MARFPDFHAFCRAFLCAAAVVLAAENGDAAVSAVPAREVSGAALNEVSALIDSMDYAIRAERDSARREILRGDQRALCAEADDLKRALLARELDLSENADGGSEAREASPSAAANAGTGRALPANAAAVAGAALLAMAAAAFLTRKLLRGSKRRAAGSASSAAPLAPRRAAARDGWRDIANADVSANAEETSGAAEEVTRDDVANDDENRSPNTEELVIQPLTPEPKRPREKRISVESPALAESAPVSEPVEEPAAPEPVVAEEPAVPEPAPAPVEEAVVAEEPAAPEPIVAMTPAALTRLEQEDRLKSDILKLAHRGYTESEIARRLKMPPEQVAQVIRLARERGE